MLMLPQVVGFIGRLQRELRVPGLVSPPGPKDMKWHPAEALGSGGGPGGGGASQSWQTPCPALSWQCDASDTCFMGLLGTFHPASRQRRASLTA